MSAGIETRGEAVLPAQSYAGPDDEPDRWQLLGTGLSGGEGITWQARYLGGLRAPLPRAVKMLRRPPGTAEDWPTAEDLRRWDDQLAVLRHLDPSRVVRLYSVSMGSPPHRRGHHDGTRPRAVYLEMEWLDGPTLDALARSRPATAATLPDRLRFVEQAAEAVADLHSRTRTGGNPALHRDLKPANCIVDSGRGLVLVDVSTLRLSDDGVDPLGRHTPGYTAPEVMAEPARAREPQSDVYSLGALAVFCLTGEDPPPASVRVTARLTRQVRTAARAAGVRDATAFADALTAAIAVDPEVRPTDVRQWARTVAALGGESRPGARRPSRTAVVAGSAAAAIAIAAGVAVLTRDGDHVPARSPDTETAVVAQPPGSPTARAPSPSAGPARTTSAGAPVTSAAKPTPSRPPKATPRIPHPSPTMAPAPLRPVGTIAAPADDASTPECSYLSGAATLPSGTTLILANQNISGTDTTQYVEFVFGWRTPLARWSWQGAQYFGSGDSSVGQSYRVRLLAVDLAEAHRLGAGPALAAEGVPLDSVELNRVPGPGANGDCPGP